MVVQDDAREQEICNLFNLSWDPLHARGGDDAWFEFEFSNGEKIDVPVEVKSTTKDTVTTARDVSPTHLEKWRRKLWVIGFYEAGGGRRPTLKSCLCLTPLDMKPWIDDLEAYILPDLLLANMSAAKLSVDDVTKICGEKSVYSRDDAYRILKKQWTKSEYQAAMDAPNGYTAGKMLDLLQQRLFYIGKRGSTLNNPHINKSYLSRFDHRRITANHAAVIREMFAKFFQSTQDA